MAANWLLGGWTRALHQQESEVEKHAQSASSSEGSSPATSPQRKAAWPLFETPAISLLRVGGYEVYNGIAYFIVIVKMSGFQWKSLKSYEDFSTLNKILVEENGVDRLLFPPRRLFGSMKHEYLEELQGKLSAYLSSLLKLFALPPHVLLDFLDYKYNDILSITETLSMLFYQRGDHFLQENFMVAFSPLQLHCVRQRRLLPIASECSDMRRDFGHLMDFLQHLKKMKVTHPSKEAFPMSPSTELLIDFSITRSLTTLVLKSFQLDIIERFGDISGQLVELRVHHSLNAISEILQHPRLLESPDNERTDDQEDRNVKWSQLKVADFSYNTISKIDDSVQLAPNLEELILSDNVIAEIENLDLPRLKLLDLTNNQIHSLNNLHQRLGNITVLCIAKNRISSLEGLQRCYSIVRLDVQDNLIDDVLEISHLSKLPNLEQLMIRGNPFTQSPSYRTQVFNVLLENAKQVVLDGRMPSKDELEVSARLSVKAHTVPRAHRRTSSREANILPVMDDEPERPRGNTVLPLVSSVTRKELVQRRQKGGSDWLSLLNKEQPTTSAPPLPSPGKPKSRRRRKPRLDPLHSSVSSPSELENSSSPTTSESFSVQTPVPVPSGLPSEQLAGIIKGMEVYKRPKWSTRVSVMEYPGALDELSHTDFEQLLSNSSMEECLLTVDLSLNRVTEDFENGSRVNQRDLMVLKSVRVHEGSRLVVALQFMPFVSQRAWLVYCLKDLESLAELYSILHKKCNEAQNASPVLPYRPFPPSLSDDEENPVGGRFENSSLVKSSLPSDHKLSRPAGISVIREKPSSLRLSPTTDTLSSHGTSTSTENSIDQQIHNQAHSSEGTKSNESSAESNNPDSSGQPLEPIGARNEETTVPHPEGNPSSLQPKHPPKEAVNVSEHGLEKPGKRGLEKNGLDDASLQRLEHGLEKPVLLGLEKPGLDDAYLQRFFTSSISLEKGEVLMYMAWCGVSLMCTTPYEIEAGIFVSNHSLYVCEVQPSLSGGGGGGHQRICWSQDALPLTRVLSANLEQVSRVMILGVFDQNIHIEVRDKSLLQSIVLFPPTIELTYQMLEQLKAAFDAAGLHYEVTEASLASKRKSISGILMVNPDNSTLEKLKANLVRDKAMIRMGNFVSTHKNTKLVGYVDLELQKQVRDLAGSFDIAQQMVVYVASTDLFPYSNGKLCLKPMTLVLTSNTLYLCRESFVLGPLLHATPAKDVFPQFQIVRSQPTELVTSVRMCDKAHFVQSLSDLMYQFSLSFKDGSDRDHSSCHWHFCVHNQQYLGRFVNSLKQHWKSGLVRDLPVVRTTEELTYFRRLKEPSVSVLPVDRSKSAVPLLVQSKPLLQFVTMSHSNKQKVFKKSIAQANFIKSDELILSAFLCRCPVGKKDEIEAVAIISNYAIYMLSDIESIRYWMDQGGVCSYSRMSLLNSEDIMGMQCFYRVWLNDVTRLKLGLLHLSLKLMDTKADCTFDILTQNVQSTMSCVAALSRCLQLKDLSAEMFADYVDVAVDPFGEKTPTDEVAPMHLDRRRVEFVPASEQVLADLKQHLVESDTTVARNSSVKKCATSMQIFTSQLVLLEEPIRIRDTHTVQHRPHLLITTNYGLYLCVNSKSPDISPCVFSHISLSVKRWVRIDDIDRIQVLEHPQHKIPQVLVHLRSSNKQRAVITTRLCWIPQNLELADIFVHYLSLSWSEKMGQPLPVEHLV